MEFVVATVDTINGQSIEDYSIALARQWRPGGQSGRGVVLVLAIKDRLWRIQVSEALRPELSDEVCKEIGDRAVPLYRVRSPHQICGRVRMDGGWTMRTRPVERHRAVPPVAAHGVSRGTTFKNLLPTSSGPELCRTG